MMFDLLKLPGLAGRKADPAYLEAVYHAADPGWLADPGRLGDEKHESYNRSNRPVSEQLVKAVWFDQRIMPDKLVTSTGLKVEVLEPGMWNPGSGPDFRNAVIRLGRAEIIKGDIEIHLHPSGWNAHGHDKDAAYDAVILHVVFYQDDRPGGFLPKTSAGKIVPQLALEPVLEENIHRIAMNTEIEGYPAVSGSARGACAERARRLGLEKFTGILRKIAEGRLILKAERVMGSIASYTAGKIGTVSAGAGKESATETLLKKLSPAGGINVETEIASAAEQVFFEQLMDCMGFSKYRRQFRRLASVLPLAKLQGIAKAVPPELAHLSVEAALFGAANLLPRPELPVEGISAESKKHIGRLREVWGYVSGGIRPEFSADDWRLDKTRPANLPFGRLAAAANIVANCRTTGPVQSTGKFLRNWRPGAPMKSNREVLDSISGLFERPAESPGGDFWRYRYTFGGKKLASPRNMIGRQRLHSFFVDVLAPFFTAWWGLSGEAGAVDSARGMYLEIKSGGGNSVADFTRERIMYEFEPAARKKPALEQHCQAFIQIYKDFCGSNPGGCDGCMFGRVLDELDK